LKSVAGRRRDSGGLERATRLGDTYGRKGVLDVSLIEKTRTHVWKPKLHEIAAGSMDMSAHEVNHLANSHWRGYRYRIGEIIGLDRERREAHVAPYLDSQGREVTPERVIGSDTLVIAIGSQSNDFGAPGVRDFAMKLENQADAARFHELLIDACIRAHVQQTPLRPEPLKVVIIGAGATGVELAAELHRTTREVVAYGLDGVDPGKDIKITVVEAAGRVLPSLPQDESPALFHPSTKREKALECGRTARCPETISS
jgi:NADH dehydrogenase